MSTLRERLDTIKPETLIKLCESVGVVFSIIESGEMRYTVPAGANLGLSQLIESRYEEIHRLLWLAVTSRPEWMWHWYKSPRYTLKRYSHHALNQYHKRDGANNE